MPPPRAIREDGEPLPLPRRREFEGRIEATVEAFSALCNGLPREPHAMERIWKESVLANTAGMYGEVGGIVGSSVPPVLPHELDAVAKPPEDATAEPP